MSKAGDIELSLGQDDDSLYYASVTFYLQTDVGVQGFTLVSETGTPSVDNIISVLEGMSSAMNIDWQEVRPELEERLASGGKLQ